MKILQVCSAESLGGGERHVIDLTRAMIERGHRLHLAVRPGSPLREELAGSPVTWHELGLRNALDIMSAQKLSTILRAHEIEVMHAHVARDYIFSGIAARMNRQVRFFLTRHHFNPIKSNPIYAWTLAEARALIAVSESVREQLLTAFPQFAERIVVIPNWVDIQENAWLEREEARQRLGITRRFAVGIVGQLTRLKRQDLFIQAAAHLIKDRFWTDADFILIGEPGPDDQDYAAELVAMVDKAGVQNNVRFTGFVEDLPAHLSAFDVICVPSQNEAFSLALIEAMAAGCAVIASRVGGMAEIVEDGVTGLFIERDNVWSLIVAISRLLSDKPLRDKVRANARRTVRDRFERTRVIDRIEALYLNADERQDSR